jgi:hypothetical protein
VLRPFVYVPRRPLRSNFEPRIEFTADSNIVSLFFISTAGEFLHLVESHDPIFPAHKSVIREVIPGVPSMFWINNSTRAGVLGCVDSYKICSDHTGTWCWDHTNLSDAFSHFENDLQRQQSLYLLIVALGNTYAWRMTNHLQTQVLQTTHEATHLIGLRLQKEQWKVEVDSIFNATLAAMQLHVYDYARGTYKGYPNMIDATPIGLQDKKSNIRPAVDISKMFKFRDSKYKNVSAVWFWSTNVLCVLVILGCLRFSTEERRQILERKKGIGNTGYHNYLCIAIFWEVVCVGFIWRGVLVAFCWNMICVGVLWNQVVQRLGSGITLLQRRAWGSGTDGDVNPILTAESAAGVEDV